MNEITRKERKFLITSEQMYHDTHVLSQVLREDPHNRGDGYMIRSLYFDTPDDRDFHEKEDGIELRRKLRLRCYAPDADFAVLEMKQKQGDSQRKRSLRMARADAQRLIQGDYSVLLRYAEPFAAECFGMLHMYAYRPKSVVEYRRKAYVAKENKIRITYDHHIIGTESCFDIFSRDLLQNPLLYPSLVVVEVKYNGFLLSYIKDMMERCNASELSVGKYSLSRALSKHYQF